MKTKTFLQLLCWAIIALCVVEFGCSMLTMGDTMLNILGAVIMAGFAFASYKTKFFTNINTKKDE